ncbi:MAG TPA: hypothetical protein VK120_08475 [Sporosarcina sp.]|nr:hypothetical protein [Sporosarcina sp.]
MEMMKSMRKSKDEYDCICGSGLSYGECCKNKNLIQFNPKLLEEQLGEIANALISYGMTNYESEIIQSVMNINEELFGAISPEEQEHFLGIMVPYQIIHEPIIGKKTVLELFSQLRSPNISNRQVKEAFSRWSEAVSSIFKIVDVLDDANHLYRIQDCRTKQSFEVEYADKPVSVGQYVIGTLLPFVHYHCFFVAVIHIHEMEEKDLDGMIASFHSDDPAYFSNIALYFITTNGSQQSPFHFDDPVYEEIADMLIAHNDPKEIDINDLVSTLAFWEDFCSVHMPQVQKVSAYAASLDYFMQKYISVNKGVTQTKVAKKYGTTPSAISNHYQKFVEAYEMFVIATSLLEDDE